MIKKIKIEYILYIFLTAVFLSFSRRYISQRSVVVAFKQKADENVNYKIYFTTDKNKNFKEDLSVVKEISKNIENVKFIIPLTKDIGERILKIKLNFSSSKAKMIKMSDLKLNGKSVDLGKFKGDNNKKLSISDSSRIDINLEDNSSIFYVGDDLNIRYKRTLNYRVLFILFCFFQTISYFTITIISNTKENKIDVAFVVFFTLILFAPMLRINSEDVSSREKRTLAKYKPLFNGYKLNEQYGNQFDKWFSDRFNNRELFMKLYRSIIKRLSLADSRVLIGKNGWLFYLADRGHDRYANKIELAEQDLANGLKYLKAIDDWCRKNGKSFYYVIAPDKNKIYGEYYRNVVKQRSDQYSIGNQFVSYIKKNSNLNAIYLYDVLVKNKDKGLLYYKQDTHWNDLGAYYGYKELLNAMKIPVGKYDFVDKVCDKCPTDLKDMLTIRVSTDRNIYKSFVEKNKNFCEKNGEFQVEEITVIDCKKYKNKQKILIIGDSFSEGLLKYFTEDFKHTIRFHRENDPLITKNYLDSIKQDFDIVIFENVERYTTDTLFKKFY